MKNLLLLALLAGLAPAVLSAQSKKNSPVDDVVLSTVREPQVPVVTLGLKAGETHRVFTVTVRNPEKRDWQVYGIQATGCFYVVNLPKRIPGEGKATVELMYIAKPGVTSGLGLLSVMTDAGEKIVELNHGRDPAATATLETGNLEWSQGGPAETKSVILTLPPGTSVAKSARAMGSGNRAEIESIGGGRYRVSITPASTAKAHRFPVFIEVTPAVPDFSPVILCTVAGEE